MSNMVVQTNVLALNSHRNLKTVGVQQSKSSARLSSGYRINSAADDAAGLAISEKMRAQIRGLDQASKNAQDAVSLIQTAEGGMQEIDNMLQRIRELTVQVSNDTQEHNAVGTGDRQKIQDEINALVEEIDSMADRVEFNKKKVIDGSFADTAAQLASATKEFDAASLEKDMAQAALDAYKTALGTSTTTGAAKDLADAQGVLDGAAGLTAYKAAVSTFAGDTATYDGLKSTYEQSKTALLNALSDASISTAGAIVQADIDGNATLKAAVNAYNEASLAIGVDELDLQSVTTNSGAALTGLTSTMVANTTANLVFGDTTPIATKGEAVFIGKKSIYETAVATYNGQVATRDGKQSLVDGLNKKIADAQDSVKKASTLYISASSKKAAAAAADGDGVAKKLYFQVGANASQGIKVSIGSLKSDILGIGDGKGATSIDVLKTTGNDITTVLTNLDTALSYVTTERSKLGATQNRLEYTQKSLDISSENLSAAESRVRDTDMAKEMMSLTKANVLQQAATSMLAQANQAPQSVLQLLQ